jgi:hypothetical protein
MSPFTGNGAVGYRVIYSTALRQELKRLRAGLADAAAVEQFDVALRTIDARLKRDPLVFGEHRYRLLNLRLAIRAAAVRPLFVSYGVHEEWPLVFVRLFLLLGGR